MRQGSYSNDSTNLNGITSIGGVVVGGWWGWWWWWVVVVVGGWGGGGGGGGGGVVVVVVVVVGVQGVQIWLYRVFQDILLIVKNAPMWVYGAWIKRH